MCHIIQFPIHKCSLGDDTARRVVLDYVMHYHASEQLTEKEMDDLFEQITTVNNDLAFPTEEFGDDTIPERF